MRKFFVSTVVEIMENNPNIFFLTGDLGYGVLDPIRDKFPDRFRNVGSSEQLMIGMAVGLSYQGYIPICYSITPFCIYRPFEMIRNYLNHENTPVKLIGTGRNKDYLKLGFSHWAEDDIRIMECFDNVKIRKPEKLTKEIINEFIYEKSPSYLNLTR
jgi:transketolase